jgi:hypothetical protein
MAGSNQETEFTELTEITPELWIPEILRARYAKAPFLDRFLNKTQNVQAEGDQVHIPISSAYSVSDVTATTGAVTYVAAALSEVILALDQWRHSAFDVVQKPKRQAIGGGAAWEAMARDGLAGALTQDVASKLLAESANLTSNTAIGDAGSYFGEDEITSALTTLENLEVPTDTGDLSIIMTPAQYWYSKKQAWLRDADKMGINPGGMLKMELPAPYGIPVFKSTQVRTNTHRENFLAHREALAWAMQEDMKIEELAKTKLSKPVVAHYLGGFKTVRANHAVVIKSVA